MRACEITLNSSYSGVFQIRKTNRKIIFSLSQAIEVSRLYVLSRTYTLQKTMPLTYTNLNRTSSPYYINKWIQQVFSFCKIRISSDDFLGWIKRRYICIFLFHISSVRYYSPFAVGRVWVSRPLSWFQYKVNNSLLGVDEIFNVDSGNDYLI